jgi:hypothetical protein
LSVLNVLEVVLSGPVVPVVPVVPSVFTATSFGECVVPKSMAPKIEAGVGAVVEAAGEKPGVYGGKVEGEGEVEGEVVEAAAAASGTLANPNHKPRPSAISTSPTTVQATGACHLDLLISDKPITSSRPPKTHDAIAPSFTAVFAETAMASGCIP